MKRSSFRWALHPLCRTGCWSDNRPLVLTHGPCSWSEHWESSCKPSTALISTARREPRVQVSFLFQRIKSKLFWCVWIVWSAYNRTGLVLLGFWVTGFGFINLTVVFCLKTVNINVCTLQEETEPQSHKLTLITLIGKNNALYPCSKTKGRMNPGFLSHGLTGHTGTTVLMYYSHCAFNTALNKSWNDWSRKWGDKYMISLLPYFSSNVFLSQGFLNTLKRFQNNAISNFLQLIFFLYITQVLERCTYLCLNLSLSF